MIFGQNHLVETNTATASFFPYLLVAFLESVFSFISDLLIYWQVSIWSCFYMFIMESFAVSFTSFYDLYYSRTMHCGQKPTRNDSVNQKSNPPNLLQCTEIFPTICFSLLYGIEILSLHVVVTDDYIAIFQER